MTDQQIVREYLDAFFGGNIDLARTFIAEDFRFKGPFVELTGRDEYFKSAKTLIHFVKGYKLLAQWAGEDGVCSLCEIHLASPAGEGDVTLCEWHTVEGSYLTSARVFFDTAAFRALLPKMG